MKSTAPATIVSTFPVIVGAQGTAHRHKIPLAIYGEATLTHFEVWAYRVNPQEISVGDAIDLSKRLDGNQTVRFS